MILSSTSQLSQPARRIVSLVPSQTELLHYLGLEEETIAITKFCIHPDQWFRSKIRVGGTKTVDLQKISELCPDLVFANKEENVRNHIESLANSYPVWVTDVNGLQDAEQMISDVGELTGRRARAKQLVHDINLKFSLLPSQALIPACYLIWNEPIMVAASGTFIDDLMRKAGFQNLFAADERYPIKSLEEIIAAKPAAILLSSEPYPFNESHRLAFRKQIPGCVPVLVDGEMFSWYGSRLLQVPEYFIALRKQMEAIIH